VTTFAVGSDLSLVLVLMAGRALRLQPEVCAAQIANADALPFLRYDVLRRVATFALQTHVSAHQRVPSLAVIELIQADFPQDRNKFAAVVFRMTLDAGVIAALSGHQRRMQSPLLSEPGSDFGMARRTAELVGAATTDVTVCAMRRTVDLVMSLRQSPGRELC